jgi:hypothetical protein
MLNGRLISASTGVVRIAVKAHWEDICHAPVPRVALLDEPETAVLYALRLARSRNRQPLSFVIGLGESFSNGGLSRPPGKSILGRE